jgi:hypothetical protein
MRKIEQQMISAIHSRKSWQSGNTMVMLRLDGSLSVYLHGNHIAEIGGIVGADRDFLIVNTETLRRWSTPTTKSRLRALGADVATRKGVTYLNNVAI